MTRSPLIFYMIDGAPEPVAPYSHAVEADGWVFVTGQLASGAAGEKLPPGIEAQTRRVMENLRTVLAGIGLGFADVVQARVFLTDFNRDYAAMNAVYRACFEAGKLPARTCVGVTALAAGGLVEIDMVARRPG